MNPPIGRNLLLPLLLISILIPIGFIWFVGWPEPDSYYFYNAVCTGKWEGTPPLAQSIFSLMPCDLNTWKTIHLIFIFGILSSLYFCLKKLNNSGLIWLIGFHGFTLAFLTGFEDDTLLMPLILILGFYILQKKKYAGIALILLFLTSFIWKGAMLWFFLLWTYLLAAPGSGTTFCKNDSGSVPLGTFGV